MGIFHRKDKNRKSIFDLSDDRYNAADSYGFIKEEQIPQNKSIRRRKVLTLVVTVILCAVLFGVLASVVSRITNRVLDDIDNNRREVDVRPTGATIAPQPSTIVIDPKAFDDIEKIYAGIRSTARAYNSCIADVTALTYISDPVFGKKTAESRSFYGFVFAENGSEYLLLIRDDELETSYDELSVSFYNGGEGNARVVRRNSELHLAVIAVPGKDLAEIDRQRITKVNLGDSSSIELGSAVIAVGCVDGVSRSVDFGFVSSDGERVQIRDNSIDLLTTNMLRREGAFGLLVNSSGLAIGILTEDFDDSECLRAITANSIVNQLNDLLNNNDAPVFGAYFTELSAEVRKRENIKGGIRITEICEGTPADEAGFRKGDTILKVQDETVYYVSQFNTLLRREASVGEMRVVYMRGGSEYTVKVPITRE